MILFAFQTCSKTIQLKSLNFYGLWLWSFWGLCRCSAWRSSGFGLQPVCCELYGCSVEPKQEHHLDWGIPRFPKSDISKVGGCISAHLLQYSIHGTTWHNTLDIANTQYIQELSSLLKCQLNFNLWNKFQNRYIFIINQTKLTKPILMVSWHILTVGCCVTSKVWLLASAMAFPTLRRPLFAGLVRPTQGRWETRSWICWT